MKGKDEQTKWGGHRASPDMTYPKILFKMLHICNSHMERINFQKRPDTLLLQKGHYLAVSVTSRSVYVPSTPSFLSPSVPEPHTESSPNAP